MTSSCFSPRLLRASERSLSRSQLPQHNAPHHAHIRQLGRGLALLQTVTQLAQQVSRSLGKPGEFALQKCVCNSATLRTQQRRQQHETKVQGQARPTPIRIQTPCDLISLVSLRTTSTSGTDSSIKLKLQNVAGNY